MMRNLIGRLYEEWKAVEEQIDELTDNLEQIAANDAGCCRIRKTPGIACGLEALRAPTFPLYDGDFPHQGLHRNSKDERTDTTANLKPVDDKGLNDR